MCESLGVKVPTAVGHLELLWHFTAEFAPQGDIGKYSDEWIESGCYWHGRKGRLIAALIEARWVDQHNTHRLVVHDWHEHADDSVKKRLARGGKQFVTGHEDSGKVTGQNTPRGSLPEPSQSQSQSLAAPKPEPSIAATSSSTNGSHPKADKRGDDDDVDTYVKRIRERWNDTGLCGPWNASNETLAIAQFHNGTPIEMLENAIVWGSMMRLKSSINNGNNGLIVSLQYFVNTLTDHGFQSTGADQFQHITTRLKRELADKGAA